MEVPDLAGPPNCDTCPLLVKPTWSIQGDEDETEHTSLHTEERATASPRRAEGDRGGAMLGFDSMVKACFMLLQSSVSSFHPADHVVRLAWIPVSCNLLYICTSVL